MKKHGEFGQAVYASQTPFDERRIGAAAIYCSDGRYGEQMDEFLHRGLQLPRYDRIALPGGSACLAGHAMACQEKWAMERQLEFLIEEHGLTRLILIAHDGCGFYKHLRMGQPDTEQQQRIDLVKSIERVESWNTGVAVEAYFARRHGGKVVFQNLGDEKKDVS